MTTTADITIEQIAQEFNISVGHARDLCEEGAIEAVNVGTAKRKLWRTTRSALDAFRINRTNITPKMKRRHTFHRTSTQNLLGM